MTSKMTEASCTCVCVREGEPDPRERASAFPTLMAL